MAERSRCFSGAAWSKRLSPLALLLLAACGDGAGEGNNQSAAKAAAPDAWLVGIWVNEREACAGSDNLLDLAADHTFYDASASGNWDLSGSVLSLTALRTFELGEEGEQAVQDPQAYQLAILRRGEGEMQVRNPEGETWQMFRCPDRK